MARFVLDAVAVVSLMPTPSQPTDAQPAQGAPQGSHRLVVLALPTAIIAMSFAALFFRQAAPTHPLVAAGTRLALATLLLLPWTVRSLRQGRARPVIRAALWAGVLYAVHFGAWVSSLSLTSVAASVTLVTATPLMLGLHGWITGRDRPDRNLWIAMLLGAAGVTVVGAHDLSISPEALLGDALALIGALAMAGYMLVGRRLGSAMQVWAFSGIATATGAVLLFASAIVLGVPLEIASPRALGYLALAALVPQLIGHTLLTWSLRHTRPTVVGIATVGEPVGATALGWLWLGERVPWMVAVGCGGTLAAVVLAILSARGAKHAQ